MTAEQWKYVCNHIYYNLLVKIYDFINAKPQKHYDRIRTLEKQTSYTMKNYFIVPEKQASM